MTTVRRVYRALVNAIIWPLVELGSNPTLLAGTVVITVIWLVQSTYSKHPWDDMAAGAPKLVLWYTIWFGLIEGATKVVQAIQARHDRATHQRLEENTFLIAKQNAQILDLSIAVKAALARSEEHDADMRDLLAVLVDRIEVEGIRQEVVDLAKAVSARLPDEPDTLFHALVARLVNAILTEAP